MTKDNKSIQIKENTFYKNIRDILKNARNKAYKQVNFIMVEAYWNIGQKIVNQEQKGEDKAKYGTYLIKELSKELTTEFGKGFSQQSIRNMRQFYNCFTIRSTLWSELSWSHYKLIIRLKDDKSRLWYMEETAKSNWSVRALERQISTHYYERIISSKEKSPVIDEAIKNTKDLLLTPKDIIKDPYVLEFLDLKQTDSFYESDLKTAIIDKLKDFLLELGRGFAFVARQKRIKTELNDFYIDLVFYNYILKCFVLIDLKRGKLTHQDIGQMDMYVNMFDDIEKAKDDNPTIGIVLCSDKDETVVKYSCINDRDNLFVSKYQMYLPSEEELVREVQRDIFEVEMIMRKNNVQ